MHHLCGRSTSKRSIRNRKVATDGLLWGRFFNAKVGRFRQCDLVHSLGPHVAHADQGIRSFGQ
jgi:hypothetical protein